MPNPVISPCEFAMVRWKNIARWRNMWTILLFTFGATVILFLCAAILLFITRSWLLGALSILVTIVNGAAVNWVVSRRTEAVQEEEGVYEDVKNQCAPPGMGFAGSGPWQEEIDNFKRNQRILFNSIR